jgi:ABC-type Fe3+-hydroxamate transport system substrate-binding protein
MPHRIVSLVPSITELLADLDLGDEVVGVTRFCTRPRSWKTGKTIVGGTKNVRIDRVRALSPTLILANHEENSRDDVEALQSIAPVVVTDVHDRASALAMIRDVGRLTGRFAKASEMAAEIDRRFESLDRFTSLRALYLIWREPYMTVGGDTFIHAMMKEAGIENVFGSVGRYPETGREMILDLAPDVVLLSSEPYPFSERHADELRNDLPGMSVRLVDGEMFSWYGSRMLYAPAYFTDLRKEPLI